MLRRLVASVLFAFALGAAFPSSAGAQQFLGTFRWQLAPFCNVVTLNVSQLGSTFTLDGLDDQCGAATSASVAGTAFPNPNGSIGVGLSLVATPGAAPVHLDVALAPATLGGPWRDSAGNTGTFAFNPPTPAAGAPRPATGGLISTVTPGAGLVGGGTTGAVSLAVVYGGSGSDTRAARADHTHAAQGTNNTAIGFAALSSNALGEGNTAAGARALDSLSSGNFNSAFGAEALVALTSGQRNTAVGAAALFSATTGSFNTAVGPFALSLATGSQNIGIGVNAGVNLIGGTNNIYIGSEGPSTAGAESGAIRIGTVQSATYIAGIRNSSVDSATDMPVLIDAGGKLGHLVSSARFKQDIQPLAGISRLVQGLEPVSFRYTPDQQRGSALQYGLIAEQVAGVMPELVVEDEEGRPFTVKYHLLPTLLLAEIQRLERERAAQAEAIEQLRVEIKALRDQRR